MVGPRAPQVGLVPRAGGEVDQQLPVVEKQSPRIPSVQPGEPQAGKPGLAEPVPLLQLVVPVADDEALAFPRLSVYLVELGQCVPSR